MRFLLDVATLTIADGVESAPIHNVGGLWEMPTANSLSPKPLSFTFTIGSTKIELAIKNKIRRSWPVGEFKKKVYIYIYIYIYIYGRRTLRD